MIVLGIDPGTTKIGYALSEPGEPCPKILDYGIISTPSGVSFSSKILEIASDISELLETYHPDKLVIEKLFFTKNVTTGMEVSQVRGVIVYLCVQKGIPVLEYTPLELKSWICWNGRAEKKQLQHAIKMLYHMDTLPSPDDAADALGLAYMGLFWK